MRREIPSIAAMAALLVGSQIAAIALSPIFAGAGFQAFQSPQDVTNTVIILFVSWASAAVILGLVRYKRQNLAKYVIMASIFITLAFVLLLPLFYALDYATGGTADGVLLGNVATVLAFAAAAGFVSRLVKSLKWYVVAAIGMVTAAGVTAILGISFGTLPAILLLIALAFYDAWAVYRTKHMITLADELTSQRLPILLVIPKKAGYSFRDQKSLKEQVASGEEREAMFIGLGDLIIPGILSVSAFTFLSPSGGNFIGIPSNEWIAIATVVGSLLGFLFLMRFVLRGKPQAGLPLLNGGAVLGFLIANVLAYGYLNLG